jgi:hypothetical protein
MPVVLIYQKMFYFYREFAILFCIDIAVSKRRKIMNFQFDLIEDKVEFFEAVDLKTLEQKITKQIEINKAIMLSVHHVSHQMHLDDKGRLFYSAVVHFKAKK